MLYIVNNHLCVIKRPEMPDEDYSVYVVRLSHIFGERGSCDSGKSSGPTICLLWQDVFRHPLKVMIPNTSRAALQSISICTSSWKTPSFCELDAPATPTLILLDFTIMSQHHDYDHMVAELMLSPTEISPSSRPSVSSVVDDTAQNVFLLTYERQTLGYFCGRDMVTVMAPTRTGRIIDPHNTYSEETKRHQSYHIAFSMHDFLDGRDGTINVTNDEHILGRSRHFPIDDDNGELYGMQLEEYSSAIWYRSDTKLIIHHTD